MKRPVEKTSPPKAPRSQKTAELLFEIGTEELPYEFVAPAVNSLRESADRLLRDARLTCASVNAYGTPRRLVLVVEGLAIHQTAIVKETMGPSKAVGFDQAGQPTKAAIGFATGQGVAVETLEVRSTPKGEYLFAVKQDRGRATATVLAELLAQLVEKLTFPKAMKWNETGIRFARPMRWLLALYGGKVVPVLVAGIKAGNHTYGHRVMGNRKPIPVRNFQSYREGLRRQGVMVDPEDRRTVILEQVERLCGKKGVVLNADAALVDQAVYTTEWPCAVLGSFKAEYLSVPPEVLMTSMKHHQGFFSIRSKQTGTLAAHFIAVANNELKDMSLIRAGNERVLAARLADASFFFNEDRKVSLNERAKKLDGVTFHQKLGTMARKQARTQELADILAGQLGLSPDSRSASLSAAQLCKADLLSGIVGEFPELQGIMGGYYAQHEGLPQSVCKAIRDQYTPRGMEGPLPDTIEGKVVGLADRLDTIVAFFCAGIIPKGSEDPFALRRHALSIVRILLEGEIQLDLRQAIDQARAVVTRQIPAPPASSPDPFEFLLDRFRFYLSTTKGVRDDVVQAITSSEASTGDVVDLAGRIGVLQATTVLPEFDPLMVGFNRANNILKKEGAKRSAGAQPVNTALLQDDAERELHRQLESTQRMYDGFIEQQQYEKAIRCLVELKPAIDRFFEKVMVNVEDPGLRENRLSLLRSVVDGFFGKFADFSKIVVQGRQG